MCRLAAFPPNFPRKEALEILENFEARNTDGTGSAHVQDGRFVINKWGKPFNKVVKQHPTFLSHMPHNGSTLAHLWAASHGEPSKVNTHPFVVGPWAFIHNGIWTDYKIAKLAMTDRVTMKGQTDSEVAANLWNIIGPKKFAEEISYSGVFMALNRDGSLWIAKTSGELEVVAQPDELCLMASEFDRTKYPERLDALNAWYHFGADGKYVAHKETRKAGMYSYPYQHTRGYHQGAQSVRSFGYERTEGDWRSHAEMHGGFMD